jgi:hypothetical protein
MAYYSDFWLRGAVLGPAWTNRPDLPDIAELDDEVDPLASLEMTAWLNLPETVRQAVVMNYLGANRSRKQKTRSRRHRLIEAWPHSDLD